jgi:hypothetical protein
VWRRLEHERPRSGRGEFGQMVELAYGASRLAWQGVHDFRNSRSRAATLDGVRNDVLEAMAAVDRICGMNPEEEALRPG